MFETKQYRKVRSLFRDLSTFQPMCAAVLEGVWPGQVWVDDLQNPNSGLLLTFLSGGGAAWCFLAGDPDNKKFNIALNKAIFDEQIAGREVGMFLFTCHPGDWGGQLSLVGQPRRPASMSRRHYICRELTKDWRANLPDGYHVQAMETALLTQGDLQLPSEVETTLEKWSSIKDQKFQDFGYLVVYKEQAVAWATVDFVTRGKGDLGFETLTEYRKRGLGSAVAAAALENGLAKGITVHWTCAEDNIGSQRTAQKLGLERHNDYRMYLFALDLNTHNAQLAYSKLANGEYQEAIELYESLFGQFADVPVWAYFDTAQACAALRQGEKTLKYLRMAVKNGWSAVEMAESIEEFQFLHGTPEWEALLERMRHHENNG